MKLDPKKADLIEELCLKTQLHFSDSQRITLGSLPLAKLKVIVEVAIACYDNGFDKAAEGWEPV